MPQSTRSRNAKLATVLAVAIALVIAHQLGLFSLFSEPARIKEVLVGLGPWGYLAFVVAYAALQPFGVPGTVFVLAAPLIWPWPVAFALSMTGTMAASVVGFSFSRYVARDWVAARIPARFRAYDAALAERGFITVATLRFIFWMPPLLHAFFGISKVRFWTHFWGSLAGYFPPLLAMAYFGAALFDALRKGSPELWAAMAGSAILIALGTWFYMRRMRKRSDANNRSGPVSERHGS